jgi:hypothetical protein
VAHTISRDSTSSWWWIGPSRAVNIKQEERYEMKVKYPRVKPALPLQ